MFRLAAEPKRWMRVTAPVAASLRLTPASLIRCVAITRWMICNTGASSSGCTAKRLRNGIGILRGKSFDFSLLLGVLGGPDLTAERGKIELARVCAPGKLQKLIRA